MYLNILMVGGQGYLKLSLSSIGSEQELLELQGSFDLQLLNISVLLIVLIQKKKSSMYHLS